MRRGLIMIVSGVVILLGLTLFLTSRRTTGMKARTDTNVSAQSSQEKDKSHSKVLIFYYSNSGTTKTAAKEIQKQTGADLVEMKISPNYPSDYNELTKVSKKQITDNVRPKIANTINMKKYDTILLGFPTWYHRPPMFINAFFETYNLKGKTIIPFTTSMSSSINESTPYLKKMVTGQQFKLKTGFRANENNEITKYLRAQGLTK